MRRTSPGRKPFSMNATLLKPRSCHGYALVMVMGLTAVTIIALAATLNRTSTNSRLNNRSVEYSVCVNAAETACERVYARMAYDFQSAGLGLVQNSLANYRGYYPSSSDNPYWAQFSFSDGRGTANSTYVGYLTNYTGALPSQYPNWSTMGAPIYRIVSNVTRPNSSTPVVGTMQMDVLLALVPITTYAIFYSGNLEFSTCAAMIVNGRVHANGYIYVGTDASLSFSNLVTTPFTVSSPALNGHNSSWSGPTTFAGGYKNYAPSVTLAIGNTNAGNTVQTIASTNYHALIDMPPAGESASSDIGKIRCYNEAETVLLVSNTTVTFKVQQSVNAGVPGADPNPVILTTNWSPGNFTNVSALFPFLTLTNGFNDHRETAYITNTQIDINAYAQWLTNSSNTRVTTKLPASAGAYPRMLYVADNRTTASGQLAAVRLVNGSNPPRNGELGFTLATPNPLYVKGNYNCPSSTNVASTNTIGTVSCALMSDSLTILSSNWQDSQNNTPTSSVHGATTTTINAAILTGAVPSTGTSSSTFSGGVHNLPRLLEDWTGDTLWINTSIMNLFNSTRATHMFQNPPNYYSPPTRKFSFDPRFNDPAKQPPGIPCALVTVRFNYVQPPPNTLTYNAVP
jgi:hypothetical protein